MKLNDIIIPQNFLEKTPKRNKYERIKALCIKKGKIDKPIIVTENNVLVDGYIRYLILIEMGIEYTDQIRIIKPTTYVYGHHIGNSKEYVWRVSNNSHWDEFRNSLQIGEEIYCNTRYGVSPVIVTRIVSSYGKPDGLQIIKKVSSKKHYSVVTEIENILARC